jgi:hypothetical protein
MSGSLTNNSLANQMLHKKLRRIGHGWAWQRLFREFDLDYWQMLSALGFSIPSRIEERWPYEMNMGNPYKCGLCESRHVYPWLHYTPEAVKKANKARRIWQGEDSE